jgi:glycosyltransferase involved in cell wall biosynthesis
LRFIAKELPVKIIIANKYYYLDGGPERYMFGLSEYLKSQGHEVIPFAMAYARNLPSEYSDYFAPSVGPGQATKLGDMEGGFPTKLTAAIRSIYSLPAKRQMSRLIEDTNPDILYCLNIVNHMSPSIIDAAYEHGVPVVARTSDYYLVCPNYLFVKHGEVCRDCENGYYHALRHSCVHNSHLATLCRVMGMYFRDLFHIYEKVGGFVTPADFMKEVLLKAGYHKDRLHHVPTFVDTDKWSPEYENDGYILYFGRIAKEKGIEFLLNSYVESGIQQPLLLAGDGQKAYIDSLKAIAERTRYQSVQFLGKKSGEDLRKLVQRSRYVVVPSMWYDNMPNVVLEAFAAGKPVIGTALGGIREQITPETGILVEAGNTSQLADSMMRLSRDSELVEWMGRNARERVLSHYDVQTHVERLFQVFDDVISKRGHSTARLRFSHLL